MEKQTEYDRDIAQYLEDQERRTESLNRTANERRMVALKNAELEEKKEKEHRLDAIKTAELEIKDALEREAIATAIFKRKALDKRAISFSSELAESICDRIASGEMLTGVCSDQSMPTMLVVQAWLESDEHGEFQAQFLKACKRRESVFADEIVMIADNSRNDYMDKLNSKTGESFRVLDSESLGRSRLRIEMRLKVLKASNPAYWGDNPSVADKASRALENDRRPNVVFNFHEAPKLQPGDNIIMFEQRRTETSTEVVTIEQVKDE